jgi:hypothetical protein
MNGLYLQEESLIHLRKIPSLSLMANREEKANKLQHQMKGPTG